MTLGLVERQSDQNRRSRFHARALVAPQALLSSGGTVDVGVFAHNEEKNIGNVLRSLAAETVFRNKLGRIFVYSASDDGTDSIVRQLSHVDRRLTLRNEIGRRGKAAAINDFLRESTAETCVVLSADVIPTHGAVELLNAALLDDSVGLAGATVLPTNPRSEFFGFVSHLVWGIHRRFEKVGEMIAFRHDLVQLISDSTSVDEACIQAVVSMKSKRVVCVPDAVVLNRGPDNILDFLAQRSRIFSGHMALARSSRYRVSTMQPGFLLKALKLSIVETRRIANAGHASTMKAVLWLLLAATLESAARFIGAFKLFTSGEQTAWSTIPSTKLPLGSPKTEQPGGRA